jgi:hypothetical protein
MWKMNVHEKRAPGTPKTRNNVATTLRFLSSFARSCSPPPVEWLWSSASHPTATVYAFEKRQRSRVNVAQDFLGRIESRDGAALYQPAARQALEGAFCPRVSRTTSGSPTARSKVRRRTRCTSVAVLRSPMNSPPGDVTREGCVWRRTKPQPALRARAVLRRRANTSPHEEYARSLRKMAANAIASLPLQHVECRSRATLTRIAALVTGESPPWIGQSPRRRDAFPATTRSGRTPSARRRARTQCAAGHDVPHHPLADNP